jgi:hypothetical protein
LLVPHPHADVEGFDFHAVILATDPSSVATLRPSSVAGTAEGGKDG